MESDEEVIPASPIASSSLTRKQKRRKRRLTTYKSSKSLSCRDGENGEKIPSGESESRVIDVKRSDKEVPLLYLDIEEDPTIEFVGEINRIDIFGSARELIVDNVVPDRSSIDPRTARPDLNVDNLISAQSLVSATKINESFSDEIASIQLSEWPYVASTQENVPKVEVENANQNEAEKIIGDFDSQENIYSENTTKSPPVVFVRRKNQKVYKHQRAKRKSEPIQSKPETIADESNESVFDAADHKDVDLNIDIDFNSSRMIIENLTNLSAFYTQSETIEFDLEKSIIQTQTFDSSDEEITRRASPIHENKARPFCDPEKNLLNVDDDIFSDIRSPHSIAGTSFAKRKLTPLPMDKPTTNATPFSSKVSTTCRDFLQPKRLKFDGDIGTDVDDQTKSIVKRSERKGGGIFDDIFEEFKCVEGEMGFGDAAVTFKTARGNEIPRAPIIQKRTVKWAEQPDPGASTSFAAASEASMGGFKTAAGNKLKLSEESMKKSRGLFDDILNEFRMENDGENNFDLNDFKGNTLNFSKASSVADAQFSNAKESTVGGHSLYKTPINRFKSKFATSTPNVPSANMFVKSIAITPVVGVVDENPQDNCVKESLDYLKHLEGDSFEEMFSDFPAISQRIANVAKPKVPVHVRVSRETALRNQQADALRKMDIKRRPGALHLTKSLPMKTKLAELGVPERRTGEELIALGVRSSVIDLKASNALDFKFDMCHFYPMFVCENDVQGINLDDDIRIFMNGNAQLDFDAISSAFLQCATVDPRLIPDGWVSNAVKWILVKLASYERSFPRKFAAKALTPANVMLQLKYRYDREIDEAKRSAIQKIVERDETAVRRMVLFVSEIHRLNPIDVSLELCDGWYPIRTTIIDEVLSNAVRKGKIDVGTKLMIEGAELVGNEDACAPLEMSSSVALKISANSTRRVKWNTKLGFCNDSRLFHVRLDSIRFGGGFIVRTRVFIARIYPVIYCVKEKSEDGNELNRTVVRSEIAELRRKMLSDQKDFEKFEKLYSIISEQVEREYAEKYSKKSKNNKSDRELSGIDDGEELWQLLENSNDVSTMEAELSDTQKRMISDFREKIFAEKTAEISRRTKEKISEEKTVSRPLIRIRVVDAVSAQQSALVTIWNVFENDLSLKENRFMEITNLLASGCRGRDLLLSTTKRTAFRSIDSMKSTLTTHNSVQRRCMPLAEIISNGFSPPFNELDFVAFVFHVSVKTTNSKFQSIYVVDDQQNILQINFWNKIDEYARDSVVYKGNFLAISNLEWRPANAKLKSGLTQAFATETSTFTENPKSQTQSDALGKLKEKFSTIKNIDEFIDECEKQIRTDFNGSNISFNQSTLNLVTTVNENGKTPAQLKIEKLRLYEDPPATPPLMIKNDLTMPVRRPFRSPIPTSNIKYKAQENVP